MGMSARYDGESGGSGKRDLYIAIGRGFFLMWMIGVSSEALSWNLSSGVFDVGEEFGVGVLVREA